MSRQKMLQTGLNYFVAMVRFCAMNCVVCVKGETDNSGIMMQFKPNKITFFQISVKISYKSQKHRTEIHKMHSVNNR